MFHTTPDVPRGFQARVVHVTYFRAGFDRFGNLPISQPVEPLACRWYRRVPFPQLTVVDAGSYAEDRQRQR